MVIFLLAFTGLFFWRPILLGEVFHVQDLWLNYPIRVSDARLRAEGVIPLWNPYVECGFPINAESEKGPLYLPSLIFDLPVPKGQAYSIYILFHYVLAMGGMIVLSHILGLATAGQLASALIFAFSGSFVAQTINLSLVTSFAWTPLILALQIRAMTRGSYGMAAAAGVLFGVSILGAHPQMSFYTLLLLGLASVCYRARIPTWKCLVMFMLIVTVGLSIGAPQFMYSTELIGFTDRSSRFSYEVATLWSLPPHYLGQLVVPDIFGDERTYIGEDHLCELRLYLGILTLGLICLGWRRRSSASMFLKIAFLGSLFLALGRFVYVYHVLRFLPGFAVMRCPARLLLPASFAGALLAAVGLDHVVSRGPLTRRFSLAAGSGFVGLAVVLLLTGTMVMHGDLTPHGDLARTFVSVARLCPTRPYRRDILQHLEAVPALITMARSACLAGVLALASALWFYAGQWRGARAFMGPSAIMLLAADLWFAHGSFHRFERPTYYEDIPASLEFLRRDRSLFRVMAWHAPYRSLSVSKSSRVPGLVALNGGLYGVGIVNDAERIGPAADHEHLVRFLERPSLRRLAIMNVKYVVSRIPINSIGLKRRFGLRDEFVLENRRCFGRVGLREQFEVIRPPDRAYRRIDDPDFDPATTAILEEAPTFFPPARPQEPASRGRTKIVRYASCDVIARATVPRPAVLVFGDLHYPGWGCWVNGQMAKILRANCIFRGIGLEAGEHELRYAYEPSSFRWGLLIAHLAVGGLVVWGVIFLRT